MKWIAFLPLICLIGTVAAQDIFTGEGYGSGQLAFYNGPSTSPFEPFVEKYWDSYVHNTGNATAVSESGPQTDMAIWYNTFPLGFNTLVQLPKTSFTTGTTTTGGLTATELDSMNLKRDTTFNFNTGDQSWKYTPVYTPSVQKTSFSLMGENKTGETSSGQIISQSIMALF